VADGNYSRARSLLWPRASAVVWLNYPFRIVLARALRRTVVRGVTREELWSGNRESLRLAFLSRQGSDWTVMRARIGAEPTVVARSNRPTAAPAISADGSAAPFANESKRGAFRSRCSPPASASVQRRSVRRNTVSSCPETRSMCRARASSCPEEICR